MAMRSAGLGCWDICIHILERRPFICDDTIKANDMINQHVQTDSFSVQFTQDGHSGRIITKQGHVALAQSWCKALQRQLDHLDFLERDMMQSKSW